MRRCIIVEEVEAQLFTIVHNAYIFVGGSSTPSQRRLPNRIIRSRRPSRRSASAFPSREIEVGNLETEIPTGTKCSGQSRSQKTLTGVCSKEAQRTGSHRSRCRRRTRRRWSSQCCGIDEQPENGSNRQ